MIARWMFSNQGRFVSLSEINIDEQQTRLNGYDYTDRERAKRLIFAFIRVCPNADGPSV
jgi:hypothetical protein